MDPSGALKILAYLTGEFYLSGASELVVERRVYEPVIELQPFELGRWSLRSTCSGTGKIILASDFRAPGLVNSFLQHPPAIAPGR
ncbi:MAG: hypothetical protein CMO80_11820 [Verrucomicrobiales bacterium]|nr:hypothetical protein [Verrucomicrobiales bacterium]